MPSSNKLNYDKVLIEQISSGITPVPPEMIGESTAMSLSHDSHLMPPDGSDASMIGVEDQGKKLQAMLADRQAFQTEFLVSISPRYDSMTSTSVCLCVQMLGEMVIGAFKHAGRRRMAFRVGTMIAQFHR